MPSKYSSDECKKAFEYRFIALLCLYSSIVILFFVYISVFFAIIAAILFVSAIIINVAYWKCPYCTRNFNIRHGSMDRITHCPYCGEKLRDVHYFHIR